MIYPSLLQVASKRRVKVGVGVGDLNNASRVVSGVKQVLGKAEVVLVGRPELEGKIKGAPFSPSEEPERKLLELLVSGDVDGVVRGGLGSSTFLKHVKDAFNVAKVLRVALLEDATGHQFMFAPVGIDEGEGVEEKVSLAMGAADFLKKINLVPRIAIISGGRLSDLGRSPKVNGTIRDAGEVVARLKDGGYDAEHYQILIEDAVTDKRNVIVAPDGISGNLIYRTLIHLGSGKSYGALYLNLPKPVIDTSRAAPPNEYAGAVVMAAAAKNLQNRYGFAAVPE
ncbi:MAG: methanogenesis marker protein Mmp4/MtxX [Candidatus Jordarchaeales archaeon]|nr:methanogenesis marker protein Mmp4/MtxX [Candidatus Jordarchaeia archaeon]